MRRAADATLQLVRNSAEQAEQTANLADAAGRAARRGTLMAVGVGTLTALFCITVVAAGRINMQANADLTKVQTALAKLHDTQHQIDGRLTTLQARRLTETALAAPGNTTPIEQSSAASTTVVVPRSVPAVPVATRPMPPVTWSGPVGQPVTRYSATIERIRSKRDTSPGVTMAEALVGKSG